MSTHNYHDFFRANGCQISKTPPPPYGPAPQGRPSVAYVGLAWTLEIAGLPSKKLPLHRETFREPDGYTISRNGFVEDGNVKCHSWRQLDKEGEKKAFFYSGLESVHLDPRGCLLWKYQLQTWNETLTATVWTKRIYIKEPARFEPFQVLIYTLTYVRDAIKSIGHFE